MSAAIFQFPRDATADEVLANEAGEFSKVLVLGYDHDGNIRASVSRNFVDGGDILWALEKFKASLIAGDYTA